MRSATLGVRAVLLSLAHVFAQALQALRRTLMRFAPLWLLLTCVFAQAGCACEPDRQVKNSNTFPCHSQHNKLAVFPRRTSQLALVPGKTPVSFGVTDTGESAMSMPLIVLPGRGVEPSLAAYYSSNGGDVLQEWSFVQDAQGPADPSKRPCAST